MSADTQVLLFHERAYERLLAEIGSKDDLAVRLGDTLDVKASILLVVITFLATQTAYFLDKHATGTPHYLLEGAGIILALATIAAFVELWPRTYMMPVPESSGVDRAAELRDFYSQHADVDVSTMLGEFTKDQIGWARTRIATNQGINRQKSTYLSLSFYFIAVGMVLNSIVLFMRLF